jgi:hypothetical protein
MTNNSNFGDLVLHEKGTARKNYGKREGANKYMRMKFDVEYPTDILPPCKQAIFKAMCLREEGMGLAKVTQS